MRIRTAGALFSRQPRPAFPRRRRAAAARLSALVLGVALAAALGCDSTAPPDRSVSFLFQHRAVPGPAGQFVAGTDDPDVLRLAREQLALPEADRNLHINGVIARGQEGNLTWTWHFEPGEWTLAEVSVEVCDGTPQMVEDDLDYWVDQVGRFCPWASYVAAER